MNIKKILKIISYYILPITLLAISLLIPSKPIFAKSGNTALLLIIFTLFIKPIAKISNIAQIKHLLIYRRQLGIASFWFFTFHAIGMWQTVKSYADLNLFLNPKVNLLYGVLAAIGMIILTITSNTWAVKKLKTNWKKIQYLAYPTLFLVLYHAAIAKDEINRFYTISGIFILLKILEWSKISFNKASLNPENKIYSTSC